MGDARIENGDGVEANEDKSMDGDLVDFAIVDGELMKKARYKRCSEEYDAVREAALFIKGARQESGMSQAALAKKLDISPTKLLELECGKGVQELSLSMLQKVALVCGKKFVLSWN